MAEQVTVYTTPTCPYCRMVKDFLKEHNILYKEVNVVEDVQARQEIIEKSGQSGVPVTEIGDRIIIGFDRDGLKRALNIS